VLLRAWWSFASSARIATRSFASRLLRGSSNRNTFGFRTIARPTATRCRCPPLSWAGFFVSWSSIPRSFAACRTRFSMSAWLSLRSAVVPSGPAAGNRRIFRENAMLSKTFMCG